MLRLQPGMMSLSRDSPERQGGIRDLELGVVAGRLGEGEPAAGHERRGGATRTNPAMRQTLARTHPSRAVFPESPSRKAASAAARVSSAFTSESAGR